VRRQIIVHTSTPTLLVIEDAQDQAILVGHAARRSHPGLFVQVTHDGFEGAAYLAGIPPFDDRRENPLPDLVILDLFMPNVDGFAVLQWMRKRAEMAHIPVVVLTSSGNPNDETRARWLGASAVYRKPNDLDELGEVVREIVQAYIPPSAMIDAFMDRLG
jgi:CheY-like chemotaxis protein